MPGLLDGPIVDCPALHAPHSTPRRPRFRLSLKLSLRRGQSSSFSTRLVIPEIAFAPMNTRIFRNYRCFRFRLERTENRSVDSSILSLATTRARQYTLPYFQVIRARMILLAAEGRANDDIAVALSIGYIGSLDGFSF